MLRFLRIAYASSTSIWAQSSQANSSGPVSDAQGAVVVGTKQSICKEAKGSVTKVNSKGSGLHAVRSHFSLPTEQGLEPNWTLDAGPVSESMSVSAAASSIETPSSDLSQLMEAKTIQDMPIGDRRRRSIIRLTGAAVFVNVDACGRTQSQNFRIDGGNAQDTRPNTCQFDLAAPFATLAELKILSSRTSCRVNLVLFASHAPTVSYCQG